MNTGQGKKKKNGRDRGVFVRIHPRNLEPQRTSGHDGIFASIRVVSSRGIVMIIFRTGIASSSNVDKTSQTTSPRRVAGTCAYGDNSDNNNMYYVGNNNVTKFGATARR